MFTVAIIGADGAGKTTVTRRLVESLPLPVRYVYMGINLEASNLVLPTTRLWLEMKRSRGKRPDIGGPADPTLVKPRPKGYLKRLARGLKTALRVANLMAEEWFRQSVVWFYQIRRFIVVFDRHFFFDYYFHHILHPDVNLSLSERLHGFVLNRFYPRPDLVVCLDAPGKVLFARKGEASASLLERRRQEYLQLQGEVKNFVRVDAMQPLDQVVEEVSAHIQQFHAAFTGRTEVNSLGGQPAPRSPSK